MPQVMLWAQEDDDARFEIEFLEEEAVAGLVSDALGFERDEDGKPSSVGVAGPFLYGELDYNMGGVTAFIFGGGDWTGWDKEQLDRATDEIFAGLAEMIDDAYITLVVELLPVPGNTFKIGKAIPPTESDA